MLNYKRNLLLLTAMAVGINSVSMPANARSHFIEEGFERGLLHNYSSHFDIPENSGRSKFLGRDLAKSFSMAAAFDESQPRTAFRRGDQGAFIQHDQDGNLKASPLFKDLQQDLLRMNDLSYNLVKGYGNYNIRAVADQEYLQKEGWTMKGFTGLEGRRSTFADLSGLVLYHPLKNLLTVVFHGTASNKEGWQTNFDAQKFKAFRVQQEFCADLFEQTLEDLDSSGSVKVKVFRSNLKKQLYEEKGIGLKGAKQAYGDLKKLIESKEIKGKLAYSLDNQFKMKIDMMESTKQLGMNIEGEVHKGFYKKWLSTKPEVLDLLKYYMNEDTKVIFTGHSQAGGVGEIALADIVANYGKDLVGQNFNNLKSHTFSGYFLSAARAGDAAFKNWVHKNVGRDQIGRQNVMGDLIPVLSGNRQVAKLLKELVPAVGEALSRYAGYDDVGHLLLDSGVETWMRAQQIYEQIGLDHSKFDKVTDAVKYLAGFIANGSSDEGLFGIQKSQTSFFSSPFKWLRERWNIAKMVSKLNRALRGDAEAKSELTELLTQRFAHLHYGFDRGLVEGAGQVNAVFEPKIVGTDLDQLLARGKKHEDMDLSKILRSNSTF